MPLLWTCFPGQTLSQQRHAGLNGWGIAPSWVLEHFQTRHGPTWEFKSLRTQSQGTAAASRTNPYVHTLPGPHLLVANTSSFSCRWEAQVQVKIYRRQNTGNLRASAWFWWPSHTCACCLTYTERESGLATGWPSTSTRWANQIAHRCGADLHWHWPRFVTFQRRKNKGFLFRRHNSVCQHHVILLAIKTVNLHPHFSADDNRDTHQEGAWEQERPHHITACCTRQNEPLSQAAGPLTACPWIKVQTIEIPACQLISAWRVSVKTQYIPSPTPFCTFTGNKDVYNTTISILLV